MSVKSDELFKPQPKPVDPFYDAARVFPDPNGLALFTDDPDDAGPGWLYGPGVLEAWLFNRLRHETYHACQGVCHPGNFPAVPCALHAAADIVLDDLPKTCPARVAARGNLQLRVNGTLVLNRAAAAGSAPQWIELDLRPYLTDGENRIRVRVHSLCEPPTVLIDSPLIKTNRNWRVSLNERHQQPPNVLAFVSTERFPHQERLPEVELTPRQLENGLWDFGVEVYGRPEVEVSGGGTVRFHPGESVPEALNSEEQLQKQHVPVLETSGGRVLSPIELALRYLRIETSLGVQIDSVKLRASTYPLQYRGGFKSSEPLLDRIWWHAAHTLRLCMRELFLDGIKRDRLPWGGDLYLAGLANAFSFCDARIMRRSLLTLYSTDPEWVDCNCIVDYSFFWIIALRDYVLHFGDVEFLGQLRPRLQRLLAALETRRDASGLIPVSACDWLFIDWAAVDKQGYSSCLEFLAIQACDAAADCFAYLAEAGAAAQWRETGAARRDLVNRTFWSESAGAYRDCTQTTRIGRHANFLAVLAGAPNAQQRRCLVENVLNNPDVPPVGTPYMRSLEAVALARCGLTGRMLDDLRQYWGGMIAAGATSFWEGYDPGHSDAEHLAFYGHPFGKSLCHAWSAGPIFLLGRDLFGLQPLAPGWARFTVTLPPLLPIDTAETSVPTLHGLIQIAWRNRKYTLNFPAGTTLVQGGKDTAGPRRITLSDKQA